MSTPLHIQTPLLRHRLASGAALLKMENLQPSGSFKMRGISLFCQRAVANGARSLVCPSGGNAGYSTAVVGQVLNVPTIIVVPSTTPASVVEKIRALGAEVRIEGSVWDEANLAALALCSAEAVYVPPFDHPDLWHGHASMIDEAVEQSRALGIRFDAVVCSVGGGGLLCGVVEGLHRNGLEKIPVIALETKGADSLAASVAAAALVTLPAITSIAGTLGAKRVAQAAFDWTTRHPIEVVTVSDRDAVDACLRFADEMHTLVEPACGAALAAGYQALPALQRFSHPLFIVCGGVGVDIDKLAAWRRDFL